MEPDVFSHICFLLSSCEIKRECNCRSGPKYCTTLFGPVPLNPVTLVPVTVPVTLNPVTLDPTPGKIPILFILK